MNLKHSCIFDFLIIYWSGLNVPKSQSCPGFESGDSGGLTYSEKKEPLADFLSGSIYNIYIYTWETGT